MMKYHLGGKMNRAEKKILIIEPEAIQKYGLAVALSRSDREIFEVSNPSEGFDILQRQQIDVIFTEIRFPAEDGMSALERLVQRINPKHIVVISASLNDTLCKRIHELGIRLIIEKPVDEKQIEIIHEIVILSKEERK